MIQERYEGEKRGLGLFLEELAPVVDRELGRTSMLYHAIRRALAGHELKLLRHARDLFNALPRSDRQALSAGIVSEPEPGGDVDHEASERVPVRRAVRAPLRICFSAPEDRADEAEISVELRGDDVFDSGARTDSSVGVLVRPNTLPSCAAKTLRDIADLIEADRRLLSERHWRSAPRGSGSRSGDADFA